MVESTVESILDFAIQSEQVASDFYTKLADKVEDKAISEVFLGFAAEERGHKAKLEAVKAGQKLASAQKKIMDLKIAETLEEVTPSDNLSYQDALIVAMKAEKAAFKLYSDLAASTDDADLRQLLEGLAQEEAKHKLRFETEYDEHVLRDN